MYWDDHVHVRSTLFRFLTRRWLPLVCHCTQMMMPMIHGSYWGSSKERSGTSSGIYDRWISFKLPCSSAARASSGIFLFKATTERASLTFTRFSEWMGLSVLGFQTNSSSWSLVGSSTRPLSLPSSKVFVLLVLANNPWYGLIGLEGLSGGSSLFSPFRAVHKLLWWYIWTDARVFLVSRFHDAPNSCGGVYEWTQGSSSCPSFMPFQTPVMKYMNGCTGLLSCPRFGAGQHDWQLPHDVI